MYNALSATLTIRGVLPTLSTKTIIDMGSMQLDVEAVFRADLGQLIVQGVHSLIDNFSKLVVDRIDAALKVP